MSLSSTFVYCTLIEVDNTLDETTSMCGIMNWFQNRVNNLGGSGFFKVAITRGSTSNGSPITFVTSSKAKSKVKKIKARKMLEFTPLALYAIFYPTHLLRTWKKKKNA